MREDVARMIVCEGTVIGLHESEPKTSNSGELFTTWSVHVFGGGDLPHYLDLPKGFDRSQIPAPGLPIRAAVSIRSYPSSNRYGASSSLTLRAVLPAAPAPAAAAV